MCRFYPPLILNLLQDGPAISSGRPFNKFRVSGLVGQELLPLAAGSDLPRISSTRPYSTACSGVR